MAQPDLRVCANFARTAADNGPELPGIPCSFRSVVPDKDGSICHFASARESEDRPVTQKKSVLPADVVFNDNYLSMWLPADPARPDCGQYYIGSFSCSI